MLPITYIVAIAATTALLTILVSQARRRKALRAYPPGLPSPSHNGNEAGFFETVAGITGIDAPNFVYQSMLSMKEGKRWVGRVNLPMRKPNPCGFLVADAEIAKAVLTHAATSKPANYDEFDFLCGGNPSIISANGHRWKHSRKGAAPAFSSNHIKRMNRVCNEELARWKAEVLDPLADSGKSFDVGKEMIYLTIRVISAAAFEYDISEEEIEEFIRNLEISIREFIFMDPFHRWFPFFFPQVWRAKRAAAAMQKFAYRVMENYRNKKASKDKKGEGEFEDDTIISRIINNPNYANDDERAADVIIFLSAGHDTTAYSIAFTLLEVARNDPLELETYRQAASSLPRDEWRRIDELQYIISEAMRLHPVTAMGSARTIGKDFVFKDGDSTDILLPKNAFVFVNFFSLFRNPKYYDDADFFRPARWANPETRVAHMPFSLGPRNCIGQTLAKAEMHTVLSDLLANYDFKVEDDGCDEYFLTLKPKGARLIPIAKA
mmetsp:Transcript_29395/g.64771  ORF Transcript_29395/g.64771 Transcript_29395/m.64771 type:complete len:493 (-) Transcript_29395:61-1539(-)|eukprot:CAMPEP_0178487582 /NCGR_PEP_ID=MMETSP0696-20121128/9397_1 /TAXON_ID=265572 /ORGANISM="Extubocellulus spinifer, Strain CCMP396" /LENGTH=492 /DNA_ID=CAMNT_0020115281 /DNA_START=833 /DNA_END=2311 /DNA_ORIENTATION=-